MLHCWTRSWNMIASPTPHPKMTLFFSLKYACTGECNAVPLELFALKVQIVKDWLQHRNFSGLVVQSRIRIVPPKHYTPKLPHISQNLPFQTHHVGCMFNFYSVSLVSIGIFRCHSIAGNISLLWKVSLSMICRCNSVPRHPWDRSLCFESERLHKLHMRSSAASPADAGFFYVLLGGGISMMDWWD